MSGFGLAVGRTTGRALIIGSAACRAALEGFLTQLGYQSTQADDPYAAMAELCRRPLAYRAVVLSLSSLYREELAIIPAIKRRYSHIELWLANVDGRAAALAEASRLGADALLADDGLHRLAPAARDSGPLPSLEPQTQTAHQPGDEAQKHPDGPSHADPPPGAAPQARSDAPLLDVPAGEPVLTADELRALLQDPPANRPAQPEP